MKDIVVFIPALDPDRRLIAYVGELLKAGVENLILLDDGSDDEHKLIFDELADRCIVLRHPHNLGKGRALKNAFTLISEHRLTDTVSYVGEGKIEDKLAEEILLKNIKPGDKVTVSYINGKVTFKVKN